MGQFVAGDIVVTKFPFSDLSNTKRRPALVLAEAEFGDLILCQITSKTYSSQIAVPLGTNHFSSGGLPISSYVRPDKLFTAGTSIIEDTAGKLHRTKLDEVLAQVRNLFSAV